jgi:hypothetical protein
MSTASSFANANTIAIAFSNIADALASVKSGMFSQVSKSGGRRAAGGGRWALAQAQSVQRPS